MSDLISREDVLEAVRDIPYADPRAFSVPLEKVMNAIANVPRKNYDISRGPFYFEDSEWDFEHDGFNGKYIDSMTFGENYRGLNSADNARMAELVVDINQLIQENVDAAIKYGKSLAKRELTPIEIGDVYDMGSDGVAIVIGFDDEGDVQMLMDDNTITTKYRMSICAEKLSHIDVMAETMAILENIRKENKGE